MKRLLLVDIGNTCMVFGLFDDELMLGRWQLSSERSLTADELALKLRGLLASLSESATDASGFGVCGIMAASVVPHLDPVLSEACEQVFGMQPLYVGAPNVKTGMAVDYKNPREVGADRIVNAVAAREAFGAPVIVLDCGTATTFDIVSPEGHYAGGLILPGMEVSLAALAGRAAKLPEVSFAASDELIGRDTAGSMQAGSYWAAVDGLSGIIRRLKAIPEYSAAPVVATGGLAGRIVGALQDVDEHRPLLTLQGLLLLARRHFR
ncbi:MAG: pantothenate kinase [Zetaproteobacteria bacterium CG12_big_fil_rev_8_21_14_0_65_55_1124]|nr:MAG: type III pantothenate kinase [Zetaproteobacteria bacterium CG1_02_55_237]PIS18831.1 MAG: pantothenate kinase [Zetaproteobacteria bacterium CG08_land_8_20_14_0_20_55_17]PIW42750.1 MAG: pantothenate kinase [Zetaproteobacteria bacterium CG12_big_fil_rev_8_21_14_0_65_55_1124]PIY51776.1 MAG: pantothenate kinase [Zetaproteobacteria bacterium CG_4_10_14_0_8_um_filter_55_43]PIZ40028.1 MAG: pantothenate kinase [Zetaproteobacteria bacterium CG_4_10_14_0_2_um_filter_55_20]PJB82735.1 MAG: pantothe